MTQNKTSNLGYWVKVNADYLLSGVGAICSVLPASTYEGGTFREQDWNENGFLCIAMQRALMRIREEAACQFPVVSRTEANRITLIFDSSRDGTDWYVYYRGLRLVAGSKKWVERFMEEHRNDVGELGMTLARLAVNESGIVNYVIRHSIA